MESKYVTAHPYAKAIFAVAMAAKALKEWSEFLNVLSLIAQNPNATKLLIDPRVNWQQRADLFIDVCDKKITAEEKNLITLLAQNDRLQLAPDIAEIYEESHKLYKKSLYKDSSRNA